MLLAIDIGNTNIVLGLYSGTELVGDWRMRTDAQMTADELSLTMRGLLGDLAGEVTGISAPIDRFTILSGRITFEEPLPSEGKGHAFESCRARHFGAKPVLQKQPCRSGAVGGRKRE